MDRVLVEVHRVPKSQIDCSDLQMHKTLISFGIHDSYRFLIKIWTFSDKHLNSLYFIVLKRKLMDISVYRNK